MHDATAPVCTVCGTSLYTDELQHYSCRPCTNRTDMNLRALAGPAGLYAQLATRLMPGSGSGGPSVSGSRTAPLPLRLEPLSLMARGGVVTILQTWLIDWHEALGWTHPRWNGGMQAQCDQVVKALRVNLQWAAASHPAFADFAHEIGGLKRQCEQQITGERAERRISVACTCGSTMRVTVSTPGARCAHCGTQYGRGDVLELPLANRMMAA
jgi:hypothetical protein